MTIAFAIAPGLYREIASSFEADYQSYLGGALDAVGLFDKYPALVNAFAAQLAYEGVYDNPPSELADDQNINTGDFHGRETRLIAPKGFIQSDSDCRDEGAQRQINEFQYTWDFDCDTARGSWVYGSGPGGGSGKLVRRWNTAAPPPNPNLNVASI